MVSKIVPLSEAIDTNRKPIPNKAKAPSKKRNRDEDPDYNPEESVHEDAHQVELFIKFLPMNDHRKLSIIMILKGYF